MVPWWPKQAGCARLITAAVVLALLAVPPIAAAAPAPPVIIVTPAPPAPTAHRAGAARGRAARGRRRPRRRRHAAGREARPGQPLQLGPPRGRSGSASSGLWPELATADLGRDATKADLDRAIGILRGRPVTSPDPASPATAIIANLRFVRALGLEPERRGLMALATADGQRLRLPLGLRQRDPRPRAGPGLQLARLPRRPGARAPRAGAPGRHRGQARPRAPDLVVDPPAAGALPHHPAPGDVPAAPGDRAGRDRPGGPALRLGRRLAGPALGLGSPGARRLRLLRPRVVGLQGGGGDEPDGPRDRHRGPHRRPDGLRAPRRAGAGGRRRARRPHLLRARGPEEHARARSGTRASRSATAG